MLPHICEGEHADITVFRLHHQTNQKRVHAHVVLSCVCVVTFNGPLLWQRTTHKAGLAELVLLHHCSDKRACLLRVQRIAGVQVTFNQELCCI